MNKQHSQQIDGMVAHILDSLMEGIMITDHEMNILMVNPAFTKITGYDMNEVIGKKPTILKSGIHDQMFYQSMWESLRHHRYWAGKIWNRKKGGAVYLQNIIITAMADSQGDITHYVAMLMDITESHHVEEKLKKEIWLARQVQRVLLSESIHHERIHIDGISLPSEDIGGDMYYWTPIDEDLYGVMIMDVAGHGVSASLVSASIRALLRGMITNLASPMLVMEELNDQMFRLFHTREDTISNGFYFTALYLLIDTQKQTVEYVNAGHMPAFAIDDKRNVVVLDQGCVPIGMIPKLQMEQGRFSYTSATKIVLFTDGLVETPGMPLGQSLVDLKQRVKKYHQLDNETFIARLLEEQTGGQVCIDDVSLVSIQLLPAHDEEKPIP